MLPEFGEIGTWAMFLIVSKCFPQALKILGNHSKCLLTLYKTKLKDSPSLAAYRCRLGHACVRELLKIFEVVQNFAIVSQAYSVVKLD